MHGNLLVSVGGALLDTLITWQVLFDSEVPRVVLLVRLLLYAGAAILGMAQVRPHPKATNLAFDTMTRPVL